jgi:hypothetical protein
VKDLAGCSGTGRGGGGGEDYYVRIIMHELFFPFPLFLLTAGCKIAAVFEELRQGDPVLACRVPELQRITRGKKGRRMRGNVFFLSSTHMGVDVGH